MEEMDSDYTYVDLHLHSNYSHDCQTPLQTIKEVVRKYGIIVGITDHNKIGGNLAAKALGIPVIPGIEVTTKDLKDFLIYFHEHDNLEEFYHKTVEPALDPGKIWGSRTKLTKEELIEKAKEQDCLISLAHPYCPPPKRSARIPPPIMRKIDAIEVMNFAMSAKSNMKAADLCAINKKAHTAGTDSHHPSTIGLVTMRGHGHTPSEFLTETAQGMTTIVGMQRKSKDVVDKLVDYLATKNLVPERSY